MRRFTPWLALGCLALVGCGKLEPLASDTEGEVAAAPDDVRLAFEESCGKAGCHSGGSPSAGLDLTGSNVDALFDKSASVDSSLPMVDLGNVANSYIALKMLDDAAIDKLKAAGALSEGFSRGGGRMPLDGDFESLNNAIILGWIAGASLPAGMGGTDGTDTDATTDGTDTLPDPTDGPIGFADHVFPIFSACSCHNVDAASGGNGNLAFGTTATSTYDAIVGVASPGAPALTLVVAGDPDSSYLFQKILGADQAAALGGGGSQMPLGGMLDAESMQRVEDWITGGAMP